MFETRSRFHGTALAVCIQIAGARIFLFDFEFKLFKLFQKKIEEIKLNG